MVLSIFDHSGHMKHSFIAQGQKVQSLDLAQNKVNNSVDFVTDILEFDYKTRITTAPKLIYAALPCQCYSKASGQFHFKNSIPRTQAAIDALLILARIMEITAYYDAFLIIENPSGGLANNVNFQAYGPFYTNRLFLGAFGFPTPKQTDIFSNFPLLLLSNPIHRVNGRYHPQKLDNLTYRKRVNYPEAFCDFIVSQTISSLNLLSS